LALQVITASEYDCVLEIFRAGELSVRETISLVLQIANRLAAALTHKEGCPSLKVECDCGQDAVEREALSDWAVAAPYLQEFMGSQANPKNFPNICGQQIN